MCVFFLRCSLGSPSPCQEELGQSSSRSREREYKLLMLPFAACVCVRVRFCGCVCEFREREIGGGYRESMCFSSCAVTNGPHEEIGWLGKPVKGKE